MSDHNLSQSSPQKPLFIAIAVSLAAVAGYFSYEHFTTSEPAAVAPIVVKPKPVPKITKPVLRKKQTELETIEPPVSSKTTQEPTPAEYNEPIAAPESEPLPELDDSDKIITDKIHNLFSSGISPWQFNTEFLRKLVLGVDNLRRGEISTKYPPVYAPLASFEKIVQSSKTLQDPPRYTMGKSTFNRYNDYIEAFANIDKALLAETFKWSYPLLEQAYGELGNADTSFQKVTLTAIDQLLNAPEVEGDIELIRPSVMFKYADPALEKLSDSDKFMLRLGVKNSRILKRALREFKNELSQP